MAADESGILARALFYAVDWDGKTNPDNLKRLIDLGVIGDHLETFDQDRSVRVVTVHSALWRIAEAHFQRTEQLIDAKTLARRFTDGSLGLVAEQLRLDPEAVKALANLALQTAFAEKGNGSDLETLAEELREHYEGVEVLGMLTRGAKAYGTDKPNTVLAQLMDEGYKIGQHTEEREKVKSVRETTGDRAIQYMDIKAHPEKALGIPTGFRDFDSRTGGLYPGEVMLVTGITKIGKSLLRERMLSNMFLSGHYTAEALSELYSSTAQGRIETMELAKRGVDGGRLSLSQALKRGQLPPEAEAAYMQMLSEWGEAEANLFFIEPTAYETLDDLEAIVARYKQRYNLEVLGVDDLHNQILRKFQTQREDLQQGELLNWLKKIALRYNLAIIAETQEDKSTARHRFVTWSEVVKYSAKLTQKADIGVRLFRTEQALYPEVQILAHRSQNDTDFRFNIMLDKDRLLIDDAPEYFSENLADIRPGVSEEADLDDIFSEGVA